MSEPDKVPVAIEDLVGIHNTAEGLMDQIKELLTEGAGDLPAPSRGDMSPGEALVYHRNRADMSQAELAEHSGVSVNTIINFENGKSHPRIRTLMKWADVLDVPWQLFKEDADE